MIFYASLSTQQGRMAPVESCFTILAALACAQLWALARGCPFRGGVEIGYAAKFNGKQILGPALSDAVRLEENCAQFPRIVIGEGARKYLELKCKLSRDTSDMQVNQTFASSCARLICESHEPNQLCPSTEQKNDKKISVLSLDVHSDLIVELNGGKQGHQKLVGKAVRFVESQIKQFSSQKELNEKLACRYRNLLNYLKSERPE